MKVQDSKSHPLWLSVSVLHGRFAQGRIKSWSSCTSQCTCFWILLCDSYSLHQANALPLLPRQVVINISYHPLNAVTKTNSNQTTNWSTPPQWMSSQSCGRIRVRRLWPHEEWNRGEPILDLGSLLNKLFFEEALFEVIFPPLSLLLSTSCFTQSTLAGALILPYPTRTFLAPMDHCCQRGQNLACSAIFPSAGLHSSTDRVWLFHIL